MPDGVQIDERPGKGHVYWTNMGSKANDGFLSRANLDGSDMRTIVPPGATHTPKQLVLDTEHELLYCSKSARDNVEVLFDGLPEPIDLELYSNRLYWTDRGDPPFGNSLNSADVSAPLRPGAPPRGPSRDLVIAERFHETIGLTIDPAGEKIYVSDLLGSLWVTELDGSNKTAILRDAGNFTGIAFHPAKSA
ncbi:hypothetical protein GGX14DRAFT_677479 [Mycena pura]|uniref:Uncharacterized protein n=1 Tax=Mycena pura TaxID=153505 RepID=A0AAD6Y0D2_9AGAR|nr:hypothetical protein GGX14DRAFT_677479 [Mycena pura]